MGGVKGMSRVCARSLPGTDKVLVFYLNAGPMGACVTAFSSPFQIPLLYIHFYSICNNMEL